VEAGRRDRTLYVWARRVGRAPSLVHRLHCPFFNGHVESSTMIYYVRISHQKYYTRHSDSHCQQQTTNNNNSNNSNNSNNKRGKAKTGDEILLSSPLFSSLHVCFSLVQFTDQKREREREKKYSRERENTPKKVSILRAPTV
jgi:hypothetical protein